MFSMKAGLARTAAAGVLSDRVSGPRNILFVADLWKLVKGTDC